MSNCGYDPTYRGYNSIYNWLGPSLYPLPAGNFRNDDFPFPMVGYVSFLEGFRSSRKDEFNELIAGIQRTQTIVP